MELWEPAISKIKPPFESNILFLYFLTSRGKNQEKEHIHSKAKPNTNSANNSMLNTWDSFIILWPSPKNLG